MNRDSANIANGASLSDAVELRRSGAHTPSLVGILMPDTWTAASVTFQVAADGTNFKDMYDSAGTEVSITAVQGHYIVLNPLLFSGLTHVKVRSGAAGAAVNQGAARVVTLVSQ